MGRGWICIQIRVLESQVVDVVLFQVVSVKEVVVVEFSEEFVMRTLYFAFNH